MLRRLNSFSIRFMLPGNPGESVVQCQIVDMMCQIIGGKRQNYGACCICTLPATSIITDWN